MTQTDSADRRPYIAIHPWDQGFRSWNPVLNLSGDLWHPQGAKTYRLEAAPPEKTAETLIAGLQQQVFSGLLLIGRTRQSGSVVLQSRAENRHYDTHQRHHLTAAGVYRATLPASEILRDLSRADLVAQVSSEADDDVGSYLLYRVLAELPDGRDTPPVGLLRMPRDMPPDQVNKAVQVTATAIARHLPALANA